MTTTNNTAEYYLSLEGVGSFTSDEDSDVTNPKLQPVPFDYPSPKPIYAHLDVDAEYQTNQQTRVITACLVGWRDYVTNHTGVLDRYTDDRYPWDKVYGTQTLHLNKRDMSIRAKSQGLKELPTVTIVLYIFATINDVRFCASPENWEKELKPELLPILSEKRRILVEADPKKYGQPKRLENFYLTKGNFYRRMTIVIKDTSAFMGNGTLETYGEMVGVQMKNKKDLDDYKHCMNDVREGLYGQELKDKQVVYCAGDCINRESMLKANTELAPIFKESFKLPNEVVFKPTFGSTVSNIIGSQIDKEIMDTSQKMGMSDDEINSKLSKDCSYVGIGGLEHRCPNTKKTPDIVKHNRSMVNAYATSDHLRKETHGNCPTTGRWLAKVDGGRAKNEIPETLHHEGAVVDVDFSGAYAQIIVNKTTLAVGRPSIKQMSDTTWNSCRASYDAARKHKYTLRQILEQHEDSFVSGLVYMRVSKIQDKPLPRQTLIQSQILPALEKMYDYLSGEEGDECDAVDKIDGSLTLLTDDIIHGTINYDVLQTLKTVCTKYELSQFLDGLLVDSMIWYAKEDEIHYPLNVISEPNLMSGTHELFDCGGVENGNIDQDIYTVGSKWYGIPMSKITAPPLSLRKVYPKNSPMNTFYKLLCNTTYGVLASVYFPTGNVCVASNITSIIRCAAWLMRVSLNGVQTITDGGACVLNKLHERPQQMSIQGLSLSNTKDEEYLKQVFGKANVYKYICKETPLLRDENGEPVYVDVNWESKESTPWNRTNERLIKEGKQPLDLGYWKLFGNKMTDGKPYGMKGLLKQQSNFLNSKGEVVSELLEYKNGLSELDELLYQHTQKFFDRGDGTTGIDILDGYPIIVSPKSKDDTPVPNPKTSSLEVLNDFAQNHIDLDNFNEKSTKRGLIRYESKGLFDGITTHGQCDYLLVPYCMKSTHDHDIYLYKDQNRTIIDKDKTKVIIKWRGQDVKETKETYESDGITPYRSICESIDLTTTDEDGCETYISIPFWVLVNPNPVKDVLFLVRSRIKLVPVLLLSSQTRWMKVNNYKKHIVSKRVKDGTVTRVELGDDQLIPIRLTYCSASQFMYRTLKQRDAWIKYQDTLKEKTGFRLEFDYLVEVNGMFMMDAHNMVRDLAWKIQRGEMPPSLNGIKWCDQPKHPDFGKVVGEDDWMDID